jgi:hypothetical protein
MNDVNPVTQETAFVWRRLVEPMHAFGHELDGHLWLALVVPILILGFVYVVWMYVRDSRSVGWQLATFLACLRCAVYTILALVFLLPAEQTYEKTETQSRVLVLPDVSGSLDHKDGYPTDTMPLAKLPSRRDQVLRFLTDKQGAFFKRLQDNNPVYLYRFGEQLDPEPVIYPRGEAPTADRLKALADWLKPNPNIEPPKDLKSKEELDAFTKHRELLRRLVKGTNLGESVLAALNRESSNRLQGVVVISDGRSTTYSEETFLDLKARAGRAGVPIFVVAVGEEREPVEIRLAGVEAPNQARPDDKFPVRVLANGKGMADKDVRVYLDVYRPNTDPKKDQPAKTMDVQVRFSKDALPHFEQEFQFDAAQLPELQKKDMPEGSKPEFEEGQYQLRARIARDRRETTDEKEHVSDLAVVNVVKRPVRVLLWAQAATREYQFVRTLFVREADKGRAEVSVYLQYARPDVVQDVPAERMLKRFPSVMTDTSEAGADKFDNLAQYDVIIAFDPDWTLMTDTQAELLSRWVGLHAGGLVIVAGPINTYQLARRATAEKLQPIINLFPVVLLDSRLVGGLEGGPDTGWRLRFPGITNEMEFLKIDEDEPNPLTGWEEFFTGDKAVEPGKEAPVQRGFYAYYPVKEKKPTATVVATFTGAHLTDGKEEPWMVSMQYEKGKVFYIGSGELWRLREYSEAFHERFWTKLARYVGSGTLGQLTQHGHINMMPSFPDNDYVRFEAQLFGPDLQPLDKTQRPVFHLKMPGGVKEPRLEPMQPKPGSESGYFEGKFMAPAPGQYELYFTVQGTTETVSQKFVVKEANPEMDNVMPDFARLRDIASDAGKVLARIDTGRRATVRQELERTNRLPGGASDEQLKLYFDLKGASVIPDCMISDPKEVTTRGPVRDLWDDGWVVDEDSEPPLKLSYALLLIIGLLSVEWLTRKLMKLA